MNMIENMELRAPRVDITVGIIAHVERILGSAALQELERTGWTRVPVEAKRRCMIEIFGYDAEEADAADVAVLEAELTAFFLQWHARCEMGKMLYEHTLLRSLKSQVETRQDSPSTTSSPMDAPTNS